MCSCWCCVTCRSLGGAGGQQRAGCGIGVLKVAEHDHGVAHFGAARLWRVVQGWHQAPRAGVDKVGIALALGLQRKRLFGVPLARRGLLVRVDFLVLIVEALAGWGRGRG